LIALRKDDEADAIFQSPQRRSLTLWNSSSKTPFPLGTLRGKNCRFGAAAVAGESGQTN
jgi:hypothetical protein